MDSVDMKLLKMLNDNARTPLREMGREVGLSTSGVRRRVKQLERSGLIQKYSALIDPRKFGYGVMAFISVDVGIRGMQALIRSLSRCQQVCELHRTTGGHGLMLKVRARDLESLNKFVDERIQSFDSVTRVRTTVAMETLKEALFIP